MLVNNKSYFLFYFSRTKIKKCVFELEESNYDWDGKAKLPKVTVTYNGQELVKNVDFTGF